MKKLIFSSLIGLALIGFTGCITGNDAETVAASGDAKTEMKCQAGKCQAGKCKGAPKSVDAKKVAEDKATEKVKEKVKEKVAKKVAGKVIGK